MVTRDYVDESRRNWAGTGPRPLRTAIWYPVDEVRDRETIFDSPEGERLFVPVEVAAGAAVSQGSRTYPLIVMSHGTGGSAAMMLWLGRYLAIHGYIAAAVNHHGNTSSEKELAPQGFLLYWERAADLQRVIDGVLSDPLTGNRIDADRIGAAGFSLGGYTVMAAAGARFSQAEFDRFCTSPARDFTCGPQDEFPEAPERFARLKASDPVVRDSLRQSGRSYRDTRIKAVFAIAPALGGGFTERSMREVRVPVEIVVGAADAIAPPDTNARRFALLIKHARLTTLPGGIGNYTFLHECTPRGQALLPICRDATGVDRAAVHATVADMALRFFNLELPRQ